MTGFSLPRALVVAFFVLPVIFFSAQVSAQTPPRDQTSSLVESRVIRPISQAPTSTLAEFWVDRAEPVLMRKVLDRRSISDSAWPAHFGAGSHITLGPDGAWYLFTRHVYWEPDAVVNAGFWSGLHYKTLCGTPHLIGTDIRKSIDQGKTWSPPRVVTAPREGTEFECMGGDGDAFYDSDTGTWHYLTQCLSRSGSFGGCHVKWKGSDPVSANATWEPANDTTGRPKTLVIKSRDLWGKICTGNALCARPPQDFPQLGLLPAYDEGTFNIIRKDPQGFFWISFHGFDLITGYRGIAKTRDFINYVAGDPTQGVPNDSIFDIYRLGRTWRENWKGWAKHSSLGTIIPGTEGSGVAGGGGQVFFEKETGLYYLIVEAADINLMCAPGQNWNVGIYRSLSLANTFWDPIPSGNPIFYSDQTLGPASGFYPNKFFPCNTAYKRVFRDSRGHTLYHHNKEGEIGAETGIMIYQFAPKQNALQNANIQRCDSASWSAWGSNTEMNALRVSAAASDLGCSLGFKCINGSNCTSGESIYQDFPRDRLLSASISKGFGGRFKSSRSGRINVALFQFDSAYRVVAQDSFLVDTTQSFQIKGAPFQLRNETAQLRFQVYAMSPGVEFIADQMFAGEFIYAADEEVASVPTATVTVTPTRTFTPTVLPSVTATRTPTTQPGTSPTPPPTRTPTESPLPTARPTVLAQPTPSAPPAQPTATVTMTTPLKASAQFRWIKRDVTGRIADSLGAFGSFLPDSASTSKRVLKFVTGKENPLIEKLSSQTVEPGKVALGFNLPSNKKTQITLHAKSPSRRRFVIRASVLDGSSLTPLDTRRVRLSGRTPFIAWDVSGSVILALTSPKVSLENVRGIYVDQSKS